MKEHLWAEKDQVELDDSLAKLHIRDWPRLHLNLRGYLHWNKHPAKELLKDDVANKLHDKMAPMELRKTSNEYMEFPAAVFAK